MRPRLAQFIPNPDRSAVTAANIIGWVGAATHSWAWRSVGRIRSTTGCYRSAVPARHPRGRGAGSRQLRRGKYANQYRLASIAWPWLADSQLGSVPRNLAMAARCGTPGLERGRQPSVRASADADPPRLRARPMSSPDHGRASGHGRRPSGVRWNTLRVACSSIHLTRPRLFSMAASSARASRSRTAASSGPASSVAVSTPASASCVHGEQGP